MATKATRNGYLKGMDKDSSRSKFDPNKYFHLQNGRIVTGEGGSSTGSVENEDGNSLSFIIPDTYSVWTIKLTEGYTGPTYLSIASGSLLPAIINSTETTIDGIYNEIMANTTIQSWITAGYLNIGVATDRICVVGLDQSVVLTDGGAGIITETVPALTDLQIIGLGRLRNEVIIFTTDEVNADPTSSYGQIWKISFDETDNSVVAINASTELVASAHLIYNQKLNLSAENRVGEIIGRYENNSTQRIYWTDNYNPVRVFNTAEGINGFCLTPSELDLLPGINHVAPVYSAVGSGSIPTPSVVQYGYRLKSFGGVVTTISSLSPPLPLSALDPNTTNYYEFRATSSSGARSVTYTIDNLDSRYDLIEHIVVIYQNQDVPQIYIFDEEAVPESGTLTVTHTGAEDYVSLTQVELNALTSGFSRAKSITQRRNRLIAANITTKKLDLDWDARAYRFNSSGICRLYDEQDNLETTIANLAQLTNVGETDDCINPFNHPNHPAYAEYKYQSDGTTIGGEGINVKYSFVTETLEDADYYATGNSYNRPYKSALLRNDITNTYYESTQIITTQYTDFASPFKHAYLRGYARGEVYRFGICFYDKAGNPSYTKWIGDIKFPEISESGFDLGQANNGWTDPLAYDLKSLGIEFTVDVSDIRDEISSFSIVRVERPLEDRTVLGTGTVNHYSAEKQVDLSHPSSGVLITDSDNELQINGSSVGGILHLKAAPGMAYAAGAPNSSTNYYVGFLSPLGQYIGLSHQSNDYLRLEGYYWTAGAINNCASLYGTNGTAYVSFKAITSVNSGQEGDTYRISALHNMDQNFTLAVGTSNTLVNASIGNDAASASNRHPYGLGNKKCLLVIDQVTDINTGAVKPMDYYSNAPWATFPAAASGANSNTVHTVASNLQGNCAPIKIVSYRRDLPLQYGGNSYADRANQKYIECNFVPITEESANSQVVTVFQGDVFVCLYGDESIVPYINSSTSNIFASAATNKLGSGWIFPVETPMNFGYHSCTNIWVYDAISDHSNMELTTYSFYNLFLQENNVIVKFITKPLTIIDVEEHPHRIWASEVKTDGEELDSWRIFSANNFLEVDGLYGEINKVISHKDRLVFYQDRAIGIASVEDRSQTTDASGAEIVLGTGEVLDYYQYMSTETGTQHQFSVVSSGSALYHIDAKQRKMFKFSEGMEPVSDIKGLSSYLDEYLKGNIQISDKTTRDFVPIGIHGEFDPRYNRVFYTFLNGVSGGELLLEPDNFTVSYSEALGAFESFHSFEPKLYLNTGRRLLSVNPDNGNNECYIHGLGAPGSFYGTVYPLYIEYIIAPSPLFASTFDSHEFMMDSTSAGVDDPTDTITSLQASTSYQDSGTITLVPSSNIIRRLRTWRFITPRNTGTKFDRLRDYYLKLKLNYTNSSGNKIILHDLITKYRDSQY